MIFDSKNQEEILRKVYNLRKAHQDGLLGGEKMPEDENPHLNKSSKENYMYFTLPMALNYQRNSYVLWECANHMYADETARSVFDSKAVCNMDEEILRDYLVKYKVALQPNKQPVIWKTLCETIENTLDGDIRNLFICNYWLYVLEQYTDIRFVDRENITVAPDTHVVQASTRLGVISPEEAGNSNVQELLASRWAELLKNTDLVSIDVHTPMWLWSRGKFEVEI